MWWLLLLPTLAQADGQACRTDWVMHGGEGVVDWGYDIGSHGAIAEYDHATIPDPAGLGWTPAPDPEAIDYDLAGNSTLCAAGTQCRHGGEFTYFATVVYLPPQHGVTQAWVDVGVVDDGVRMTVFNSASPQGVTDPGGYAFLGGGVSSDLLPYMSNEPWNTIVLTHVDDCCSQAYIRDVSFVVYRNGREEPVSTDCDLSDDDGDGFPPAGGDCDDADPDVRPLAPEVLNGIDDDCDGVVDEGTEAFDDDGDGLSEQDGDCDDDNPFTSPDADEQCGQWGIDYDCDGCPGDTDPDCGGDCGLADDDGGDDDDATDAPDDDDATAADDDDSSAPPPSADCSCFNQSLGAWVLALPWLGLRRRR